MQAVRRAWCRARRSLPSSSICLRTGPTEGIGRSEGSRTSESLGYAQHPAVELLHSLGRTLLQRRVTPPKRRIFLASRNRCAELDRKTSLDSPRTVFLGTRRV